MHAPSSPFAMVSLMTFKQLSISSLEKNTGDLGPGTYTTTTRKGAPEGLSEATNCIQVLRTIA